MLASGYVNKENVTFQIILSQKQMFKCLFLFLLKKIEKRMLDKIESSFFIF